MLVRERMSRPVITIKPETPIVEAHDLMRKEHIRRLPVIDERKRLVGIVSEEDLLHAEPSDATSLSIFEVNYLMSRIVVKNAMTRDVITINEDTPLEEAAHIMAYNKIGGLPVLRDGKVVGIITETDLFNIFLELLGAREHGIRLAALVPNTPGGLVQLTKAIFDIGGGILTLGTFLGESCDNREVTMKVAGVSVQALEEAIEPFVERIVDVHETQYLADPIPNPNAEQEAHHNRFQIFSMGLLLF
jgi:acetoin utilization protein AcuB